MPDDLSRARARAKAQAEIERNRSNAPTPQRRSALRDLVALDRKMAESAMDMVTGGASGFVADAATALGQPKRYADRFTELRDERRARRESMPWYASLVSAAPAMVAPLGPALGAIPRTAGILGRIGRGAAEGMVQGGAMGVAENLGTSGDKVMPVIVGAGVGAGFGGIAAPIAARFAGRGEMAQPRQNAARMLTNAVETEGFRAVPSGPNMPSPIAADALGEIGQGIVKAAGRLPEARTELRPVLEGRVQQMFPSLLRQLDEATGTTTDEAVRLAATTREAEAVREAGNKAIGQRTTTEALDALRAEGDVPDVDATLRSMHKARSKAGEQYTDLWETTRGVEVPQSKAADDFAKTDAGKAAIEFVKRERANEALVDPTRALPKNGLDAAGWHRVKELINKRAQVGAYEGPLSGVGANEAAFLRDNVLPTLAAQNKAANAIDLQYASMSDEMRAFAAGAGKGRWSQLEDKIAKSPALMDQYRAGLRARYGQLVRRGASRDQMAARLADPNTKIAQDFEIAFGQGSSQRIAQRLGRQAEAPPSPEATGFFTGERVFDAPAIGSGSRASVSEELQSLFGLPMAGQKAGQQGLAGRYRNELLEGRPIGLETPAARERFGVAATSPDAARGYAATEAAWDAARKGSDKMLSGDAVVPAERVPDIFGDIAGGVSMNPGWWLTLSARRRAAEMLAEKAAKRQGETAREVVRIAKDKTPDAISNAILALKQLQQKKADFATRASARAGRIGGSLFDF